VQILVTGGAGYVGSVVTPLLLGLGHRVRVLDSLIHGASSLLGVWSDPGFELAHGDLRDEAFVEQALGGCEAVVHLAAVVGDPACAREPELARAVNYDASLALIAASRRAGVGRFVFASTCSNYGRMPDPDHYVDEDSPLRPISLYAETKVAVEQALNSLGPDSGICATPLRFATVYGVSPRMRFDLTVNEFTLALIADGRLAVYGEQFWRPYVHVRDVARAVAAVLAAPRGLVDSQVFNVGSTDANYRKADLVDLIRPHAPDATIEFVHRDEDPRDYRVSFARIRERLGFEASRSVPEGIAEVAALVRSGAMRDLAGVHA
jgi:nucleoside-diphosphate-sugar epimerase